MNLEALTVVDLNVLAAASDTPRSGVQARAAFI